MKRIIGTLLLGAILGLALAVSSAHAQRIKDLTQIQGVRNNQLVGYGLVVGLAGDGDSNANSTLHALSNRSDVSRQLISDLGRRVRGRCDGVERPAGRNRLSFWRSNRCGMPESAVRLPEKPADDRFI